MRGPIIAAALAATGCASGLAPQAPVEPAPLVVATFQGEVDAATGTFTIRSEPTALGQALGVAALVIPESSPGVTVANVAGSTWNASQVACGSTLTSGATVRVTSSYASPTLLGKLFAEITALTPAITAACNSDAPIPGVTASKGGLWSYGDVAPAGQADRAWAFTWSSGVHSIFSGRIVAFRVDAWTSRMPAVSNVGYRMSGAGTSAVFVDSTARKIVLVDSAGMATESAPLSTAPTGVATNHDGSQIWVSLGGTNGIAHLDRNGALVGAEIPIATTPGGPAGIAVDPGGVVWFSLPSAGANGGVGWYDPISQSQGFIAGSGNGTPNGPVLAVSQGTGCFVYAGTSNNRKTWAANCATRAVRAYVESEDVCQRQVTDPMVADAGGVVWYVARNGSGTGTICRMTGSMVTQPVSAGTGATFSALAYGPDGNLWAMHSGNGLCRIWLGATDLYTETCLGSLVPSTVSYGIASGAGAVWSPKGSGVAGSSDLTRVLP